MNQSTSTLDFTKQHEAARVLPQAPLIASYHTGWKGLTQILHLCRGGCASVEEKGKKGRKEEKGRLWKPSLNTPNC
jgi:hypothetical protein